eukprot:Nk52_evm63s207 gene=Nk52_evmTU63s207
MENRGHGRSKSNSCLTTGKDSGVNSSRRLAHASGSSPREEFEKLKAASFNERKQPESIQRMNSERFLSVKSVSGQAGAGISPTGSLNATCPVHAISFNTPLNRIRSKKSLNFLGASQGDNVDKTESSEGSRDFLGGKEIDPDDTMEQANYDKVDGLSKWKKFGEMPDLSKSLNASQRAAFEGCSQNSFNYSANFGATARLPKKFGNMNTQPRLCTSINAADNTFQFYNQSVRNPTKCTITIDDQCRIIISNSATSKLFGYHGEELTGMDLNLLLRMDGQKNILGKDCSREKKVVIDGKIIEGIHKDGSVIPISLWMKKVYEEGSERRRYVVVIEKIQRSMFFVYIDEEGNFVSCDDDFCKLAGVSNASALRGTPANTLIPGFDLKSKERQKLAGRSKDGHSFPACVKEAGAEQGVFKFQVEVFANISGLVSFYENGIIHGCNHSFVRLLFGYGKQELVSAHISKLIPNFYKYFEDGLLHSSFEMVNKRWSYVDKLKGEETIESISACNTQSDLAEDCDDVAEKIGSIREGALNCTGRHKNGVNIELCVELKRVCLENDHVIICAWISRDISRMSSKSLNASMGSLFHSLPAASPMWTKFKGSKSSLLSVKSTSPMASPIADHKVFARSNSNRSEVIASLEERYKVLQNVGKGAFGFVSLALDRETDSLCVVKFIFKEKIFPSAWVDTDDGERLPREIVILRSLSHPHIVRLLNYFENDEYFQIVMAKHGPCVDLFDYIEGIESVPEHVCIHIFRQVLYAIQYLHSKNIVHRDMKDENIILDDNLNIQLIDFGSAAYFVKGELFTTFCGTLEYCSPEVLRGNAYQGPELEVWSLGVTMYTLVFGENPFYDVDECLEGILNPSKMVSIECLDFISAMLTPDPVKRATVSELIEHPFMNIEISTLPKLNDKFHNDECSTVGSDFELNIDDLEDAEDMDALQTEEYQKALNLSNDK